MADGTQIDEPVLLSEDSELAPKGITLVLGMTWKVILGKDLSAMAVKMALASKSNYYTHSQNIGSVGYTTIKLSAKTSYVSAASIVALQHPIDDFLIALVVNDSDTWLCGVSNGVVVSGYDTVVRDQITLIRTIREFKERFTSAKLHGDIDNGFEDKYHWSNLSEGLARSEHLKNAVLRKTTRPLADRFGTINKKYLYVGATLFVLVFGQKYALPVITKVLFKPAEVAAIDPAEVWQESIDAWVLEHQVSTDGSLNALLGVLADQPIVVAGWRQSSVDCVWGRSAWSCTAKYSANKRTETNQAFADAKPKNWNVNFMLIKDAVVKFQVPTESRKLTLNTLKPVSHYELVTASEIQSVAPLLPSTVSPITAFSQVAIVEPKTEKGAAIALPAEISLPKFGVMSISGPLRNISAYQSWINDVAWTNVNLKIDLTKVPSTTSSTVTMELKGNIYASK